MTIANFSISEARLIKLGEVVSKERKKLRSKAMDFEQDLLNNQDEDLRELSKLAKKVDKGYFPRRALKRGHEAYDFEEDTASRTRRRSKKRTLFDVDDKVDIVHRVLVEHELVTDVAKEYRVSVGVVQAIVAKAQK